MTTIPFSIRPGVADTPGGESPPQTPQTRVPDPQRFSLPFVLTGLELEYIQPLSEEFVRGQAKRLDLREWREVAETFSQRIQADPNVLAIWATWEPGFEITVSFPAEPDLDQELQIQAVFTELASELSDPGRGDLSIVVAPNQPDDYDELIFQK